MIKCNVYVIPNMSCCSEGRRAGMQFETSNNRNNNTLTFPQVHFHQLSDYVRSGFQGLSSLACRTKDGCYRVYQSNYRPLIADNLFSHLSSRCLFVYVCLFLISTVSPPLPQSHLQLNKWYIYIYGNWGKCFHNTTNCQAKLNILPFYWN